MFEKLFNKKLIKMRKHVEDDKKYAKRMMLIYYDEVREDPSNIAAKEQHDFWRGRYSAFTEMLALIDISIDNARD